MAGKVSTMNEATKESGPQVLVIDDMAAIVEELTTLLTLQGIPATGARTLTEAVAILEREPAVRIIACDIWLDGESGLDIVYRILARAALRDRALHYAFITGSPAQAGTLPADLPHSILAKPVSPQDLVAHFRELLAA